jgi:hypothetical protein
MGVGVSCGGADYTLLSVFVLAISASISASRSPQVVCATTVFSAPDSSG